MIYWILKNLVIGPVVKAIFRPWVVGRSNIPTSGAAIIASNHLSVSDSIFFPLMIDRQMSYLAKSDYFTGTGIKGMLSRWFFAGTGQHPIDRTNADAAQAAMNAGLEVLSAGEIL
ncbi:lysophospholipid acyltransferase family protein [Microbacterium sp.]|uniref:lysophospholipid acyltransferase family protein n=1 Tax=Microbacterium sp. TaxID=51671 RepID=UPI00373668E7